MLAHALLGHHVGEVTGGDTRGDGTARQAVTPRRALRTIAAENPSKGLPNIVYLDQVDPYLCKVIIDANDWHAKAAD